MTSRTPLPSGGTAADRRPAPRVIPPIEQSVDLSDQPADFLERYYECRYLLDCREPGHDYRLLFHSNGLIVVMLAPSHPLVTRGVAITGIDFQVTEHTNRLDNRVQGKGKRGAQVVTAEAPLFRVSCADGRQLVVPACARGKLIQLNERLRAEPHLLTAGGDGFVAVILPKLGTSSGQKAGTVDSAEYARRRMAGRRADGDRAAPAAGLGGALVQCSGGGTSAPVECSGDRATPAAGPGGALAAPVECDGGALAASVECDGGEASAPIECNGGGASAPVNCGGGGASAPVESNGGGAAADD